MKKAKVLVGNVLAGILTEDDMGYEFRYDSEFLKSDKSEAVSLTLPLTEKAYRDKVLFPFFGGRRYKDRTSFFDSLCRWRTVLHYPSD